MALAPLRQRDTRLRWAPGTVRWLDKQDQPHETHGQACGLFTIHYQIGENLYSVCHRRTGYFLCYMRTLPDAERLCLRIADFAPWGQVRAKLRLDPLGLNRVDLHRRVLEAAKRIDPDGDF